MSATPPKNSKWLEAKPCLVCGRKSGHCTRSADGIVLKCNEVESDRPVKQKDGSVAYLHAATAINGSPLPRRPGKEAVPKLGRAELETMLKRFRTSINPARLKRFAEQMGLRVRSLENFEVGRDVERTCWSFPMRDGERKLIGFRLRADDGHKLCVPGSQNGLFIPLNYDDAGIPEGVCESNEPLLIVLPEGVTDAIAVDGMGFRAIGRPSDRGGANHLRALLAAGHPQQVVMLADRDWTKRRPDGTPFWPGHEGGLAVCEHILPACGSLAFMKAPEKAKDVRAWMQAGGGGKADLFGAAMGNAERVTPKWLMEKKAEVELWRKHLARKPPEATHGK
jgi:hypothetical protein